MRVRCERGSRTDPARRLLAAALGAVLATGCFDGSVLFVGRQQRAASPFSPDRAFGTDGMFVLDLGGVDNTNWSQQAIDVQPDGRIVLGASGSSAQNFDFVVVRLLETGELDPSFGAAGIAALDLGTANDLLQAVRVQPDGKLLLAGVGGPMVTPRQPVTTVARLLSDGRPDPSFAGTGYRVLDLIGGGELANAELTLSDGRLRLCGQAWPAQTGVSADLAVYGLLADGSTDPGFGAGGFVLVDFFGSDEFGACAPDEADGVLVYGTALNGARAFDMALARVRVDGSLDPAFGVAGRTAVDLGNHTDSVGAVLRLADRRILVAGTTEPQAGQGDAALVRLLPDGSVDPTFGTAGMTVLALPGEDTYNAMLQLPDGRVVCGGSTTTARGDQDFLLAVFNPDGSLDAGVGSGGLVTFDVTEGRDDGILSMKLDSRGRLLLFGQTSDGTSTNVAVMRLTL